MSEENEKNDTLERRKALGLFGLVAGAAAGTALLVKDPSAAVRLAGQSAVIPSPLPHVPDVLAPGGYGLVSAPGGEIGTQATSVRPSVPSKSPTTSKKVSTSSKAKKSTTNAQPPRVNMSGKDSKSEASRRKTENTRISTERTKQQVANEKKYIQAQLDAQAKIDKSAKSDADRIAAESKKDAAAEKTLVKERDAAFRSGKVAAAMAPNLYLSSSNEWHLARRASMGSNKRLVEEIQQVGYSKWIDRQLDHLNVEDSWAQDLTKKIFPLSFMNEQQIFHHGGKDPNIFARLDMSAGWLRQCISNRVIFESMVELWRDHLHVKQMNDKNKLSVISYDQTIREHALGKYKDLFFHALIHPAMLHYLDNQNSKKENPNQNLGREMLELHSLGAGNHTEADVAAAAVMLTGHSTSTVGMARVYAWKGAYHATGTVKLSTGFTHANSSADQAAATQALKDMVYHLATRRATATKIATKLCVRFVADNPPATLIKELADVYLKNDTDIKPVLRTLFNHSSFKSAKGTKWRRPSEVNAMMFRALGLYDIDVYDNWASSPGAMLSPMRSRLTSAGQEFQQWDTPDGFPDKADYWMAPSTMVAIWNMTEAWANRSFNKCHFIPWAQVLGVTEQMDAWFIVDAASDYMYGITLPYEERRAIAGYLATGDDRKMAPEWEPVGAAALNARINNTMRLIFCNPRMMVR